MGGITINIWDDFDEKKGTYAYVEEDNFDEENQEYQKEVLEWFLEYITQNLDIENVKLCIEYYEHKKIYPYAPYEINRWQIKIQNLSLNDLEEWVDKLGKERIFFKQMPINVVSDLNFSKIRVIGPSSRRKPASHMIAVFLENNLIKSNDSTEFKKIAELACSPDFANCKLAWSMIHQRVQNITDYIKIGLIILRYHVYDYEICKIDGDHLTIFGKICNKDLDFMGDSEDNLQNLYQNISGLLTN